VSIKESKSKEISVYRYVTAVTHKLKYLDIMERITLIFFSSTKSTSLGAEIVKM
jgi:hypothetical protein